jgi:hypothetical protein
MITAVLAGALSFATIAEWATDPPISQWGLSGSHYGHPACGAGARTVNT